MSTKTWIVYLFLMKIMIWYIQAGVIREPLSDQLETFVSVGQFLRNWGENDFWWKEKLSGRTANINKTTSPSASESNNQDWLPNSNKIGLSYNPLVGDPVCFSGDCQMNGFGLPLFQMKFTETATGTCVKQRIPQNVEVDCLPSTEHVSTTEAISDLQGLKDSQSNGVTWGIGFKLDLSGGGPLSQFTSIGFNYKDSKQTRFMIDNLYKKDSVVFRSYVKVSYLKLSLYEPLLNLSVAFRHVIENMPHESSNITDRYINDYILSYFGPAYISNILLGGIAQMTSTMSRSKLSPQEDRMQSTSTSAGLTFGKLFNFNYRDDDNSSNERINSFTRDVSETYSTTLGGDVFVIGKKQLSDWFLSVPSNPVIIHFTIGSIVDLLTDAPNRFPSDPNIKIKANLILQALANQVNQSKTFCENDCTDDVHGTCTPTKYFQFGQCRCNPPFTGKDCSIEITTTTTPSPTTPPTAPPTVPPIAPLTTIPPFLIAVPVTDPFETVQ